MRIVLNLASQPFIEMRPLYLRLRIWMAVVVVIAIPLWLMLRTEERHAAEADARMALLQASVQKAQADQARFQSMMHEPANAAVLSQSEFLNQLFARKAFSWTAVMIDLEDVLPTGVQVLNIDPVVAPDGAVTIRLRVAGPRSQAVELVRNLEHSHRFLQPRLASEAAETTNANGPTAVVQPVSATSAVDFDILADYNPLPNKPAVTAAPRALQPLPHKVHPAPGASPAVGKPHSKPSARRPGQGASGE
jgi:type IV pilus assembly protein PilN